MVFEAIISVILCLMTLITVLKKGEKSIEYILIYIIFLIILTLIYTESQKAILAVMSISPFIYLLHLSQINKIKAINSKSSVFEKVLLYFTVAPFFGFLFLEWDMEFLETVDISHSDLMYFPECILIFFTLMVFLELISVKGKGK